MTGHEHLHAGDREHRGHIAGGVVGGALARVVVRAAGPDEGASEALVAEVELQLLERPLSHEGCERVCDRMEALHREPGRDPHHRLLGDADVHGSERVASPGIVEQLPADLREHDRDPRIVR